MLTKWIIPVFVVALAPVQTASQQTPSHGFQEFKQSATFEVPPGVSQITTEIWGPGGGGGGGAAAALGSGPGGGGGGGGGGSYVLATFSVTPGERYVITVGVGGRGGRGERKAMAERGTDGGDSSVALGTRVLFIAQGGAGGLGAPFGTFKGGLGGDGGTTADIQGALVRQGRRGADGHEGGHTEWNSVAGGAGGAAVPGTQPFASSAGGAGGSGRYFADGGGDGLDGANGSVIVKW
jgi:hypothetical protein